MLRFAVSLAAIALAFTPMVALAGDNDRYRTGERVREGNLGNWEFRNVGYDRPGTVESRREWRRERLRNGDYDRPGTVESRREWRQDWRRNGDYDRRGTVESRREWRREAARDRYLRERYRDRYNDRYDRYDPWGYKRDSNYNRRVIIIPRLF